MEQITNIEVSFCTASKLNRVIIHSVSVNTNLQKRIKDLNNVSRELLKSLNLGKVKEITQGARTQWSAYPSAYDALLQAHFDSELDLKQLKKLIFKLIKNRSIRTFYFNRFKLSK